MSKFIASVTAAVGAVMVALRHKGEVVPQATGTAPAIPAPKPQGKIPTLKMPTARGWSGNRMPKAAEGLKVRRYAGGLKHPRSLTVLPNGDVLTAEARFVPGGMATTVFDMAMQATMKRAAALGDSPNRVILLRDADGDGVAEETHIFRDGLNQPFGTALVGNTLYIANTDALLAFDYTPGATRLTGEGRLVARFKPGGHWTRSLIVSPDQTKLYVGVGSLSNIGDDGIEAEEGRACIWEVDLATGAARIFAGGLRNPVGMAWGPKGDLWTVVNERDGLGDETPPDYLTSVKDGAFYGWPWCWWGQNVDDRVPANPAMVATAIRPDFALGGHTASLGLCWLPDGVLPGFGAGMVIGQHGSWNRSKLSGYRVVHVPFRDGVPVGPMRDVLTGFLSVDEKSSWGRPVGVCLAPGGGILVADDVGDVVWRVE